MSKNFYFEKWKHTIRDLKKLVDYDVHLQVVKAHDATLFEAVRRLSGVLGEYMVVYNHLIECCHQNLQVQKTAFIDNIIKALVSRIFELKAELEKLEGSRFQFIGHGLIAVHHTVFDIDLTAIPLQVGRPEHIQEEFDKILARVKEMKEVVEEVEEEEEKEEIEQPRVQFLDLWGFEVKDEEPVFKAKEVDLNIPEEVRKTREYLALILAHEKSRQVIKMVKKNQIRREMWVKELTGTLQPPARYEIRERSSQLICKVFREYFKLKRQRIKDCKRDQLLGINICDSPTLDLQRANADKMLIDRSKLRGIYEKEWIKHRDKIREEVFKSKQAKICDELRDQIREWFLQWFDAVRFFYDIPKEGPVAIFNGNVPDPEDWYEQNEAQMMKNAANKKKSPQDLKFEKLEAKKQEKMLKQKELMKNKSEALLLKKMMKNPTMHPGYKFPVSKTVQNLKDVIDYYHQSWDIYDIWGTNDVKEKHELKKLKQALSEDYKNLEKEIPKDVTKPMKKEKQKKIIRVELNDNIRKMIEELALQDIIVEYPRVKLKDFLGDPNFGGEDLRRLIVPTFPFNYEIRAFWWERCRDVSHGFNRILLVGPRTSGKTILVKTLASMNKAVLFDLDPDKIQGDLQTAPFLKRLMKMVVTCAKVLQPCVIHVKHVQKLFYIKTPTEDVDMNYVLIKKYFVQYLVKNISKTDNITIVVLLLPDNTYSQVVLLLEAWVIKYEVIPANLNVTNLAHTLRGYSFGYLKDALERFMSADRIIKIAAYGLTPLEVLNYILEDESAELVEYDKYLKWYHEKTAPGMKEAKHLQEQLDYRAAFEKYVTKAKKEAKSAPSSATTSNAGTND
ncbi:hypothetical protein SFRURICE_008572 [Spodoptera frugiperda]|nr:hypothetical protein SFRURICE_008572 [Spodoptera frugiperda]